MFATESPLIAGIAGFAKRRRRWLIGTALGVLAYAVLGFLLAPWLVKNTAVDTVGEQLDAELRLAKVAINPFVLSIRIDGLELDDPAGTAIARVGTIYANFQLSSLVRWAWSFAEIRLDAPELFLARAGDGGLNLAALVPPADTEQPESAGGGMPRLFIHRFAINEARVDWRDEVPPEPVATVFGPVSVQIVDLNTLPDRAGEQSVVITTESNGTLSWTGSLQLNPFASAGHAEVRGSHFPLASAYIRHETGVDIVDGTAGIDLDYAIASAADGSFQVTVDNIDVEFADVRVNTFHAEPDDVRKPREFLHVPRLAIAGGSFRWPEREVRITDLGMDSASLELRRLANGSLDFAITGGAGDDAQAADEASVESASNPADWNVALDRLAIDSFAVRFEDLSVEPAAVVGVRDFMLEIVEISNAPGASFPTNLAMTALQGGKISATGTVTVLPVPELALDLAVERLALAGGQPYLRSRANVNLDSGHLNLDGRLAHTGSEPFALDANVEVIDLLITETDAGTRLGSWSRLLLDQLSFSVGKRRLDISEVLLDEPYGDIRIAADGSVNLGRVARGEAAEAPATPAPEAGTNSDSAAAFVATIGRVIIDNAAADFADESLPLPFSARINDLNGSLTTIATDSAEPSTVELEGGVDEYGLFRMTGVMTPLDVTRNTDVAVEFENVDVPKFSAYSIPFAGREIASGKLDLDLGYQVQDRKLVGSNRMVLREFELGEKVPHPGAASLPLGLAVALLKDPSGKIDIDLPVSGDLDDPEFGYGRVIGKALANLIVKIAASPFALLGNLVGAEASELEYINFQPGRADLTPPELERIGKLTEALTLRPVLRLEISGVLDREVDSAALRTRRVDDRIEALLAALDDEQADGYTERRADVIETSYRETTGAEAAAMQATRDRFTFTEVDAETGKELERFDRLAYTAELRRLLIELEPLEEAAIVELARLRARNTRAAVMAAAPELEPRVTVVDLREESGDRDPDTVRMKVSLSADAAGD